VTLKHRTNALHIHHYDNLVISFGSANLHVETIGAAPVDSRWKSGEVRFNKAASTHGLSILERRPFTTNDRTPEPGGGPAGSPNQNEPAVNGRYLK